jgi:hypothetical protein
LPSPFGFVAFPVVHAAHPFAFGLPAAGHAVAGLFGGFGDGGVSAGAFGEPAGGERDRPGR